ncbi:unnamed protein product [Lymnaea stagnalis]|uniref:Mitochondrial 28S ribosomal protein S27 n=1 Tax=Lymnaea stagnalis TaxID=6523 RepID=A0AAV2GX87_LYMST
MAASLRLIQRATKQLLIYGKGAINVASKRYLLSESYSCREAWQQYMEDPVLKKVSLSDFAFEIRDQLEKSGHVSAVDMNVLAHQFHAMEEEEVEFLEDVLAKYNFCQTSVPRNDSTTHAVALGFLSAGHGHNLVKLFTDFKTYGIFPNHYTLNITLDWFIKQQNFADAAKISYISMLQEDFSNPSNALLCLYASVRHLLSSELDQLACPPVEKPAGEEEEWIKVKYIKFPYYDDHFDIKDERFLLGKTLLGLGNLQSVDLPNDLRNSLKIIGSGIYHKFPRGLKLLKEIADSSDGVISQEALQYFSESLEKVDARDPNEPEVELALRTIDDVIHRLLPTTDEKQEYLTELSRLQEKLKSCGKIVPDYDLGKAVEEIVSLSLSQFEILDISAQKSLLSVWTEQRRKELDRQMEEHRKNERIEEMKRQVKELQEQEEILTYFDFEEKLRLKFLEEDRLTDKALTISK